MLPARSTPLGSGPAPSPDRSLVSERYPNVDEKFRFTDRRAVMAVFTTVLPCGHTIRVRARAKDRERAGAKASLAMASRVRREKERCSRWPWA